LLGASGELEAQIGSGADPHEHQKAGIEGRHHQFAYDIRREDCAENQCPYHNLKTMERYHSLRAIRRVLAKDIHQELVPVFSPPRLEFPFETLQVDCHLRDCLVGREQIGLIVTLAESRPCGLDRGQRLPGGEDLRGEVSLRRRGVVRRVRLAIRDSGCRQRGSSADSNQPEHRAIDGVRVTAACDEPKKVEGACREEKPPCHPATPEAVGWQSIFANRLVRIADDTSTASQEEEQAKRGAQNEIPEMVHPSNANLSSRKSLVGSGPLVTNVGNTRPEFVSDL
jgi:hypothetical protein